MGVHVDMRYGCLDMQICNRWIWRQWYVELAVYVLK